MALPKGPPREESRGNSRCFWGGRVLLNHVCRATRDEAEVTSYLGLTFQSLNRNLQGGNLQLGLLSSASLLGKPLELSELLECK